MFRNFERLRDNAPYVPDAILQVRKKPGSHGRRQDYNLFVLGFTNLLLEGFRSVSRYRLPYCCYLRGTNLRRHPTPLSGGDRKASCQRRLLHPPRLSISGGWFAACEQDANLPVLILPCGSSTLQVLLFSPPQEPDVLYSTGSRKPGVIQVQPHVI